ncbi:MAG: protein translocase subunit SecD [Planctomycetota bacterium]
MTKSLFGLVTVAMSVSAIVMGSFGGMAYGLYYFYFRANPGDGWISLAFLVGVFTLLAIMCSLLKSFFTKYNGRLVFAFWLIAILGAYFVFLFQQNKYPMGIDLAGGTELIYSLDYSAIEKNIERLNAAYQEAKKKDPNTEDTRKFQDQLYTMEQSKKTAPDKAAEIVRRRVDPTGTKGIPVTTLGTDKQRLRIQLPRATQEEVDRIKNAIQTQGRLSFHIAAGDGQQEIIENTKKSPTKTYTDPNSQVEYELQNIEEVSAITGKKTEDPIVIRRAPEMDGSHVALAAARRSQESVGRWEISLRFDATGSTDFGKLTQANIKKRMAIMLDGKVYSAPTIQDAIFGECRISGNFTEKKAEELAAVLTAGSLPADVKQESEFTVGPSMGREQIQSGMQAVAIGSTAAILFILFYYRFSGVVASFCTLLNILMLLGAMGFFKATLTLPGIAGIVLTLGMAMDANVLILERLREELAAGRPLKLAVSHGFDRAFLTIMDCNLTTLISGIVLYYLGTGPVRGFAVTLSIGILTTLFCNLWLNWIMTEWLVNKDVVKTFIFRQFFKRPNLRFMAWRRWWMTITGAMVAISITLFLIFSERLYDVDFKGGTLIQFNFAKGKEQNAEEIKRIVDTKVRNGLAERLNQDRKIFADAIATGKTGLDLRAHLIEKMTEGGDVIYKEQEGRECGLKDIVADLDKILNELPHADLTTQSFGSSGEKGACRSFTVTTKMQNSVAVKNLRAEILRYFAAELEPQSITLYPSVLEMRFAGQLDLTPEKVQDKLKPALATAASTNSDIKDALLALRVAKLEKTATDCVATLTPLPEDPTLRNRLFQTVESLAVADRVTGLSGWEIQMRLDDFKAQLTKESIDSNFKAVALEAAKDSANQNIKDALLALQVNKLAADKEGYLVAHIAPLPADSATRDKVFNVVKPLKVNNKIGGPISRVNSFGSQVASEMKWQALLALIIANLGIWIYLWFRFEFSGSWGFGAIVAVIHDATIATGAVVVANLLGEQFGFTMMFNLNTVAALLTIVGFSVNDTIVCFDRIREVKAMHPTRQLEDIVDEAINATLSRTVLTSLTVLLAAVSLLAFGGPTIRDLSFTLIVGFIVGIYSSIYIASPLMIWWYRRFDAGQSAVSGSGNSKPSPRDAVGAAGAQV